MAGLPMVPVVTGALSTIDRQQMFGLAIIGVDILQNRMFKIVRFVEKRMKARDEDAAQEMVNRMRADVPRDRGDLFNGIRFWEDDGAFVVQASGVRTTAGGVQQEDHAGFVEHGTQPGQRGRKVSYVADSNYHTLSAGIGDGGVRETGRLSRRQRLQYRGHPGTDAQPFFYGNARDVLNEREADADDIIGEAVDDDSEG